MAHLTQSLQFIVIYIEQTFEENLHWLQDNDRFDIFDNRTDFYTIIGISLQQAHDLAHPPNILVEQNGQDPAAAPPAWEHLTWQQQASVNRLIFYDVFSAFANYQQ